MVEIRTLFDAKVLKILTKFQLRKLLVIFIIISLSFTTIGIVSIVYDEVIFGIIMSVVFGVGYIPLVYLLSLLVTKLSAKKMPLLNGKTVNYFKIEANNIYIEQTNDSYIGTTKADFTFINQVSEDKANFYIYISGSQAHVLPKADFISGTAEELSVIFKETLGKKFKKYK